ncbi:MAG: hypothetical protein FJX72_05540 [Armatimonadetes bacterium]|nr:hypothetical protein [Armatimonadota bacterium]
MRVAAMTATAFGALAFVCIHGARAQVITEDFASYPEGVVYGARWEFGGLGWAIRSGRLACEAGTRTTAVPASAPHGRSMTFEVVMRPERSTGSEWKTAGIAIAENDANFWQLSLVEGPEASGRTHSLELHEMLKGRWLANIETGTALAKTVEDGAFAWDYGRDYRLRIELTPERIVGVVEEIGSSRRYRVGYTFSGACVRAGQPMLVTSALSASYAYYRADITETASTGERAKPPVYSLKPMSPIRRKATGFFRVEKVGERWWVVDPRGYAFYVVGTDHVSYNAHWCEKLGYAPYSRNVQTKFGSEEAWAASSAQRLKAWGFNTLGAGHSESVRRRGLVHTAFLSLGTAFTAYGDIAPRTTWTGFPDVFDPRFAQFCAIEARKQCAPHRDDPWLLGYFLDNELEWFGKNGSETGLVDEAMKKPADHPAKRAFVNMLRKRHTTIGALNAAWKTSYASWDALASAASAPTSGEALKDRAAFVRLIAERYFSVTCDAIRRADPNHMILGCRFAGFAPPIWDIAGRHLDIVSVNYYGNVDLEKGATTDMPAAMERYYAEAKRPLLITEWSFPALDAGLPSRHGAGQRVATQADKARAYAIYQTALFAMPFMVGSDYFMWVDEPALGISSTFPEDSNYGLVDVNDRPWPELTAIAARLNPRAVAIHSGATSEVSAKIGDKAVLVRNTGAKPASFLAEVWVQGVRKPHALRIGPGKSASVPIAAPSGRPSFVRVHLDRQGALVERRLDDNSAFRVIGRAPRDAVVVVNPGSTPVMQAPIVVRLPAGSEPVVALDNRGRPLKSQTDRLPGGDELAFIAGTLPPSSTSVFRLKPSQAALSTVTRTEGGAFAFAGRLDLRSSTDSRNVLDSVSLGSLRLGRFAALVHQTGGQPLWVEPDRVTRSTTYTGPVRTVRIVECLGGGGRAITAADPAGAYAAQQTQPGLYGLTVRLDAYPDEPWFGVRVLRIANRDTRPWRLEAYFLYPASSIGGGASDDAPGGTGDAPRWHDPGANASYGALVDPTRYKAIFWKDTPDGESEHPDIYRTVQQVLKPGEAFAPASADPEVRLFGTRGDSAAPGSPELTRLRALARLRVER